MQQERVKNNPALMLALSYNLASYKKHLAYYQVVVPIKQRRWLTALREIMKNPHFFSVFISQLNNIIKRRIQYYVMGNKSVFDMSYNLQKKRTIAN
jgi:succinoglycan biosynthesis protein ExoO